MVNVYDRERLFEVVAEARPEVVVHLLTDLAGRDYEANSRIRREGTRNLVDAAVAAGARKLVVESVAFELPPAGAAALAEMERIAAESGLEHEILRFGLLWGPHTWHEENPGEPGREHVRDAAERVVVARPRPPLRLRAWYREGQRRFGVPWNVLAAVNFVESGFGKLRNDSVAGAQGPMQFMPATWRAYGLGGNVHDPHDAILGAANYLRANGAARDLRTALWHYNPSKLYVDAVLGFARRIRADRHAFLSYYAWSVFVRTTDGERRVTGP